MTKRSRRGKRKKAIKRITIPLPKLMPLDRLPDPPEEVIDCFSSEWLRILAIDPGSAFCGFSIIAYNKLTKKRHVIYSRTDAGTRYEKNIAVVDSHNKRYARLLGYGIAFRELLESYDVAAIVSESPFNRFANTFQTLSQQILTYRIEAMRYDVNLRFTELAPTSIKSKARIPAKGSNKEHMKQSLLQYVDLSYDPSIYPKELDEHEVDSIWIGIVAIDNITEDIMNGQTE